MPNQYAKAKELAAKKAKKKTPIGRKRYAEVKNSIKNRNPVEIKFFKSIEEELARSKYAVPADMTFKDLADAIEFHEKNEVNNPAHYTDGKIEVIDFIEDKKLGFHLGNAVKYIARAGKKDASKLIQDLEKAQWYLNRYIANLKAQK